jgi:FixJ family two-component response regulator
LFCFLGWVVVGASPHHRIREALEDLLESVGYVVRVLPSAEAFLDVRCSEFAPV